MKNRLFLRFSLLALVIGAFVVNGCKDTATDPGYVALAEIRFANYHQVEPIQIYMYPQNATYADSGSKTPVALTYGKVTPYFNNLPTNRTAGEIYHLVAKIAGTAVIVAEDFVTLMPGDQKTWLISGNGIHTPNGAVDHKVIDDSHPYNNDTTHSFFRFLNVSPTSDFPNGLSLMIGDPFNGTPLATNQAYQTASAYQAVPIQYSTGTPSIPLDTSITFYVVSGNIVLGRLSGVGLAPGSYHTLTWGGATVRIPDPTTGNLVLDDTLRIRILDDDQLGTDQTLTAPLTFRYNIINALVVPVGMVGKSLDYKTYGGLDIVINNNTVYDYQGVQPFNPVPYHGNISGDSVFSSVPATVPSGPSDVIYIKMVKPFPGNKAPSPLDTNLFRLYAQRPIIKSDEIYSIVVFDTARPYNAKALDNAPPYDSTYGTVTVPIPDVPVVGSARIVLGHMLAAAYSGPNRTTSSNKAQYTVNGVNRPKTLNVKTFDSTIVVPAGNVDLEASVLETDVKKSFIADPGGIYEAFLVGQRLRPNPIDGYQPQFIIVRVNPIFK